jgi:hypothetical protein
MRSSRVPRGATGAASASDRHWAAVQRAKRTIADVNRGVWRVASALLGLAVHIQRVVDYRPRLHCAHACLPWLATAESISHRPGARMCSAESRPIWIDKHKRIRIETRTALGPQLDQTV